METMTSGVAEAGEQPLTLSRISSALERHAASVPVDVERLALDLGLRVWHSPTLEQNVSGKIIRDPERGGPSGYAIYVNANEGRRRRRFTVAHEIAHFILHGDLIGNGVVDDALYRSILPSHYEVQANRLAADILMPRQAIDRLYAEGIRDPAELAKRFDVSTAAMKIRLRILGLLEDAPVP